jgi:hypothetical protein
MNKKEELAKIFASGSNVPTLKILRELSFIEGWDACMEHLASLPLDEAANEIVYWRTNGSERYCKSKEDRI